MGSLLGGVWFTMRHPRYLTPLLFWWRSPIANVRQPTASSNSTWLPGLAMSGLQFQAALGGAVEACGSLFAALPEVELLDELGGYLGRVDSGIVQGQFTGYAAPEVLGCWDRPW